MNDGITIAIITFFASLISVLITQGIAYWVNKKKLPSEIRKIDSEGKLINGNLTEKYQAIASKQADENIELSLQLKSEREEKNQLAKALDELRKDLEIMKSRHADELRELKESFEEERKENEKWRDWARRLVIQIQSFGLIPVPFDIEEAKRLGSSLGDIGSYPTSKKIENK